MLRSEDLATNVVFQALSWTDTCNHYLRVEELPELLDEDETEMRRILKDGNGHRWYHPYTTFLRSVEIIPRQHSSKTHWCLVGVGSVHIALNESHHRLRHQRGTQGSFSVQTIF